MKRREPDPETVDLHGLAPAAAQRRVIQELHAARVRGLALVRFVTGRGWGNPTQEPILRKHIEAWLHSPEGRRAGALEIRVTGKGGSLDVRLR